MINPANCESHPTKNLVRLSKATKDCPVCVAFVKQQREAGVHETKKKNTDKVVKVKIKDKDVLVPSVVKVESDPSVYLADDDVVDDDDLNFESDVPDSSD